MKSGCGCCEVDENGWIIREVDENGVEYMTPCEEEREEAAFWFVKHKEQKKTGPVR